MAKANVRLRVQLLVQNIVALALEQVKFKQWGQAVAMRAADHQLQRPLALVQAEKVADGKGEIRMRSMIPAPQVSAPVSAECKM